MADEQAGSKPEGTPQTSAEDGGEMTHLGVVIQQAVVATRARLEYLRP